MVKTDFMIYKGYLVVHFNMLEE
ncbi:hypothetical protein A1E_05415 [Rickettsia canadensis str. McKiel]|uniref:Uncharacterized protein n=2 Tax=Rickettsia canadensis TaxID=788 RepID=A8F066_RICCK|nr:hypothetical protein A1E_05415 [Rickettsia canadensis str. McKiel]AFB21555.1 hypothetical protein RCA_05030 [Rickettsia canadensis str. CA410]